MVDPPSRYTRRSMTRRIRTARSLRRPKLLSSHGERGSATIWAVCALLLVSAAVGCALIWVAAESTRHAAERAADAAALAAASAALRRLAMQDKSDPCIAAAKTAGRAGAHLIHCDCAPLDCTVTVRRDMPFLGPLTARIPGLGPAEATSRAGPVGETGEASD
jgi:secretion/DNA translocation related TadE-like protein